MVRTLTTLLLFAFGVMVHGDSTQSSVIPVGFTLTNDGDACLYSPKQDFKLVFRDGAVKLLQWTSDEQHPTGMYETVLWAICPTGDQLGETLTLNQAGNLQMRSKLGVLLWSNPVNDVSSGSTHYGPYLVSLDDSAQLNEYSYYNTSSNGDLIWSTVNGTDQNSGSSKGACFQYGDCSSSLLST